MNRIDPKTNFEIESIYNYSNDPKSRFRKASCAYSLSDSTYLNLVSKTDVAGIRANSIGSLSGEPVESYRRILETELTKNGYKHDRLDSSLILSNELIVGPIT